MKDDTEKYKDITSSGTRRIVQLAILPEAINRLKAVPRKKPMTFFSNQYKYS